MSALGFYSVFKSTILLYAILKQISVLQSVTITLPSVHAFIEGHLHVCDMCITTSKKEILSHFSTLMNRHIQVK